MMMAPNIDDPTTPPPFPYHSLFTIVSDEEYRTQQDLRDPYIDLKSGFDRSSEDFQYVFNMLAK